MRHSAGNRLRATPRGIKILLAVPLAALAGCAAVGAATDLAVRGAESFTIESAALGETRRVNVLVPTVYGRPIDEPMDILLMLDGGMDEDFLHVAGLVQVMVSNGTMRPHILVGVENTARRRDLTPPTTVAEDRAIAPTVGGAATFRAFLRDELLPTVRARHRTTAEAAIVGESLAGLFLLDAFFAEPTLFRTYIAIDPSLWWNDGELLRLAAREPRSAERRRRIEVVASGEPSMAELGRRFALEMAARGARGPEFRMSTLDGETHATIYHPAAMLAFRAALGPVQRTSSTMAGPQ